MILRQGNSVLAAGIIGNVRDAVVMSTKYGEVQVRKFGMTIGTDENGNKIWTDVECWGAKAQDIRIKGWNSVLVCGEQKTSDFIDRNTGEKREHKFIRADLLLFDETAKAFENIAKSRAEKDEMEEIPDLAPDEEMPF